MRQKFFTLFLLFAAGLLSCRKSKVDPDIKQYDNQQILNYISVHGLTGMKKDTMGGDTSGIYYRILSPTTGTVPLQYTDTVSLVFTLRTLDGVYQSVDTINNHFHDYLGHIVTDKLPLGLQTAIINDLKYKGGSMQVLIPSHLAYGTNGYGSGSSQVANSRIKGNESLDYFVRVIDNKPAYDDMVIQNYMKNNSLTGYTKTASGIYFKILTAATGSDPITINSTITYTNTGQLFNGTIVEDNNSLAATKNIADFQEPGIPEVLMANASVGTKISILLPSEQAYGTATVGSIPTNSCLRFTYTITAVTP